MSTKKEKSFFEEFSSVYDLIDTVKIRPMNETYAGLAKAMPDYFPSSEKKQRKKFCSESLEQAYELALNGDKKAYNKQLKYEAENISLVSKNSKEDDNFDTRFDFRGGAPVVPLALMGVPRCFRRNELKQKDVTAVRLYIDISVAWFIDESVVIKAGLAVEAAVKGLIKSGVNVEIYICDFFTSKCRESCKDRYGFALKVKSFSEPLNAYRLSYFFQNVSYLRRIGFKWIETIPVTPVTEAAEVYYKVDNNVAYWKDKVDKTHHNDSAKNIVVMMQEYACEARNKNQSDINDYVREDVINNINKTLKV